MKFNEILSPSKLIEAVSRQIKKKNSLVINGLDNSSLIYYLANLFGELDQPFLLIAHDNYHLMNYYEDLIRLVDKEDILLYPEIEILPHEQIAPDPTELSERLAVLEELLFKPEEKKVILVTIRTLLRRMMPVDLFRKYSLALKVGLELDLTELTEFLSIAGYERVHMVEEERQFSLRGGILDIYTISRDYPVRIEFFGDEIDSIREFDPATQRSRDNLQELIISSAREIILSDREIQAALEDIQRDSLQTVNLLREKGNEEEARYLQDKMEEILIHLQEAGEFPGYEQFLPYYYQQLDTFLDYLPGNTLLILDQANKVWHNAEKYEEELAETYLSLLEQGSVLQNYLDNFQTTLELYEKIRTYTNLYIYSHKQEQVFGERLPEIDLKVVVVESFNGKLELLAHRLRELIKEKYQVIITLNSATKARRVAEFLQEEGLPAIYSDSICGRENIIVKAGSLAEGFIFEDLKLVVYTEKEVFGRQQKKKRRKKNVEEGLKISSLEELKVGDYVVHENHGIGKYLGVQTMEIQGKHQDYLVLKYAGEDRLYVPTDQIDLVQKYIGADEETPKLYKLGGSDWKRVKQKVKQSVKEMAFGLLELYAERETIEGYAFSRDTVWQQEFEEAFPYEETPDQLKAIEDVKKDMESNLPMDRLLCGDVGYGKTEVAIRAAFKAVMDGKQAAVLVPTTILAQQHYNTFRDRMNNYPINIAMISRFRTPREQKEIIKKLATGEIDIVIGTHRLLSDDIIFDDLGLLIIDEEQRFGVTHKEKLKNIKRNVDVLTMTATPIPRTLHMALVGVRDMSVIETPPENRYPIRTYIWEFNPELIRDAIRREMARGGQIYFVHNRVEDIERIADFIRKLVPDCKVVVAHGQMSERKLERIMLDFYQKEYDLLVCTTIIETGLDLASVNTIIINRAEQMGLAQLYQLRGRVGRSDKIAYAYLLYGKNRILPEVAEKRLKAIKEFTNLGSGFKIAMRDLEIRGAGNLLGPEQHGHIASVGFSLYCKLLDNAIKELQGKKFERDEEVEIKLNIDAYIPDEYIGHSQQKIEFYKKISKLKEEEDFLDLVDELIDRFGEPPLEVMNLIKVSQIRAIAIKVGINMIYEKRGYIYCKFVDQNKLNREAIIALIEKYPGNLRIKTGKETEIGVKTNQLEVLEKILTEYHGFSLSSQ